MFVLSLSAALGVAHAADDGPGNLFQARFRQGTVPRAILDNYYFDAEDLPAGLAFGRPDVNTRIFGVEWTKMSATRRSGVQVWAERFAVPIEDGYWNDREDPQDNTDGQWISQKGLGAWALGANYVYDVPIVQSIPAFKVSLGLSAGLGIGVVTGKTDVWRDGNSTEANGCEPDNSAPERRLNCDPDGSVEGIPPVLPILDLTVGPRFRIIDRVLVRIDLGFHDSLYWGVGAGIGI